MPRAKGTRNPDFDVRRAELLVHALDRLAKTDEPYPSFRELAEACGVRETTLRHYFGRREDLIVAVLADFVVQGAPFMAHVEQPKASFRASVHEVVTFMASGYQNQTLRALQALGLAEGLRNSVIGPAFLELVFEPGVRAFARRLDAHVARGQMRECDTRMAALMLLSPVFVAMLHQVLLGGVNMFPLAMPAFLEEHVKNFVRVYAPVSRVKAKRS